MLDLHDIQGNILKGYRSFGRARFMYFRLCKPERAAAGIGRLLDHVTAAHWGKHRPDAAVNVAISFRGLCQLDLPADCLASFPGEFQVGMAARAKSLGDVGDSAPEHWDKPWQHEVHLVVMIYSDSDAIVAARSQEVINALDDGAEFLPPHQDCAVLPGGRHLRKEHFGFLDGLSNPVVAGEADPDDKSHRQRRFNRHGNLVPLAAGEFILGQPDEGREVGKLPVPDLLARNGTFLVLRKLGQLVGEFRKYLREQAAILKQVTPGADEHFLAAKMVGRWPDGTPLTVNPERPEGNPTNEFDYRNDVVGAGCPIGAHIRRANPRDSLGFDGRLVDRHRLIRRGIPYGPELPEGSEAPDDGSRGAMFVAFNASIARQFEFVQQQWIEYGDSFGQGNDMDPLLGSHDGTGKMVIPGDIRTGRPPLICAGIPRFVRVRGGEYFFVPSLTALRLIATREVVTSS